MHKVFCETLGTWPRGDIAMVTSIVPRTKRAGMKWIAPFFMLALAAATSFGAVPDFEDAFNYGNGQDFFATPTNGWQSSGPGAYVTNSGGYAGNAAFMGESVVLSNNMTGGAPGKVWTDFQIKPSFSEKLVNPPTNSSSFLSYFDTNGIMVVATPWGLQVCTNDVWGNSVPVVSNAYVRVSVFQNFSSSNEAVFLNDQLIVQDLPFAGSAGQYNQFEIQNTQSNCWLDSVWVKTLVPGGLTNNLNHDAENMGDAVEIQTYGYAARTLYFGAGSGYPPFPTIQAAVNSWRSRDTVYVYAGTYAENVTVTNPVTFTGGAFTNSGTLTVSATSGAVFQNAMNWGTTVNVDTNSQATFSGALVCSNFLVRSGAVVTAASVTCSNLTVEPGAHFTCTGPFQCAGVCAFSQGAVAGFSNSVFCAGVFAVANGASINLAQGATLGTSSVAGAMTVGPGYSVAVNSVTINNSLPLTLS